MHFDVTCPDCGAVHPALQECPDCERERLAGIDAGYLRVCEDHGDVYRDGEHCPACMLDRERETPRARYWRERGERDDERARRGSR